MDKEAVKVIAEADFQVNQMMDMLRSNLAKRGVDARAMDIQEMVHSGKSFSQQVKFKNGIETPVAKKITKAIKDAKMKVQTQIQGEQVRVTGKKRDDLQAVIQLIKDSDFEQPFQFENFRD